MYTVLNWTNPTTKRLNIPGLMYAHISYQHCHTESTKNNKSTDRNKGIKRTENTESIKSTVNTEINE